MPGRIIEQLHTSFAHTTPEIIHATLVGNDTCQVGSVTVHSTTPIIAMCCELIKAGVNPATPLDAYRGATLCLAVRAIGEAAKLEINSKGTAFVNRRGAVRTAPPIPPAEQAGVRHQVRSIAGAAP